MLPAKEKTTKIRSLKYLYPAHRFLNEFYLLLINSKNSTLTLLLTIDDRREAATGLHSNESLAFNANFDTMDHIAALARGTKLFKTPVTTAKLGSAMSFGKLSRSIHRWIELIESVQDHIKTWPYVDPIPSNEVV